LNVATILGKAHGLCAVDVDNPEAFKQARNAIGLTEETCKLGQPFPIVVVR